jgi:hypothetical protein
MSIVDAVFIPGKLHIFLSRSLLIFTALSISSDIHAVEAAASYDDLYQSCIEQDTGFGKMSEKQGEAVCSCVVRRAVESNLSAEVINVVTGYFRVKKLDELKNYWMQDMSEAVFESATGFTDKISYCRKQEKISLK